MLDLVLMRRAVAPSRVAPIVLGDECGLLAVDDQGRRALSPRGDAIPVAAVLPRVIDAVGRDPMPRRQRHVRFVVDDARDQRDRDAWHDFLHEHDATAHDAIDRAADVEPQVDLVEVGVERDREPLQPRLQETKRHEADDVAALPRIEFDSARDQRREDGFVDVVLDEHEVAPGGAQEHGVFVRGVDHRDPLRDQTTAGSIGSGREPAARNVAEMNERAAPRGRTGNYDPGDGA
jgi:hypothetical protein